MNLVIDATRLSGEIEKLAGFSDAPAPAVTRILWTPRDLEARAFLRRLFESAALKVRQDALGNIFARWDGAQNELPAVATGSHTDAIPHSGRFDGVVGVLGALEAIRALQKAGFAPRRAIELVMFTSEEPTRFGLGCLGSRAMCGALSSQKLRSLKDGDGISLEEARQKASCVGDLESVRLPEGFYEAFIELHIEQGPLLEAAKQPLGIVTAIAAPATLRLQIDGEGGHAGARLMPGRRDALLAGAELALQVEKIALSTGVIDTVATTGFFGIHPGAVNSIPSRANLEIDVRDIDGARRDGLVTQIHAAWDEISARRKVSGALETLNADPPATCAPAIVLAVQNAAKTLGAPFQDLVSRAYHDALFMARVCPTGMIFIPSKDGISHRPDEYSSPAEIALGVQTLALTLAELAA